MSPALHLALAAHPCHAEEVINVHTSAGVLVPADGSGTLPIGGVGIGASGSMKPVACSSRYPELVDIQGYTPCRNDAECPEGQPCNDELERCEDEYEVCTGGPTGVA